MIKKIHTTRFGEIEYEEKDIVTFPEGIPGLESYKQYTILRSNDQAQTPFFFLQSIAEGDLCFFILDTLLFFPDYEVQLDEHTLSALHIEQREDVLIYTIITVSDRLQDATTNLKAPLVLNHRQRIGKQLVLDSADYVIKQPLFAQDKSVQSVRNGR